MKTPVLKLGCLLLTTCLTLSASGESLIEDFEEPFPAWESGWLASNTNLQNYYGVGEDRGNNPDGLWIDDGDGLSGTDVVEIDFDPAFGSNLTSLSLDVAGWTAARLMIFDTSSNLLLDEEIVLTRGGRVDPGEYARYAVTSTNGISRFAFAPTAGGSIEGNTSIDNVTVTLVPEPSSLVLFGLAASAGALRLRRGAI